MPNRLKPLNYTDFTGGVNLRPEAFQLLENELPELLNLEVDPRGGLNTRKSWKATHPNPIDAGAWNPHAAAMFRLSTGSEYVYVASAGALYAMVGGVWSKIIASGCNATPHMAEFASWGDSGYVHCGWNSDARKVTNGTTVAAMTAAGAGNWQDDIDNPGATATMVRGEYNSTHAGYLFVADTGEGGVRHPSRLRWSHPNNPERFRSEDYIDIVEGGNRITGIIGFSDRLLIFKPDSVWALFGYESDSWELTNISRTIGLVNYQLLARNEAAVFFMSWPHGIFVYTEKGIEEISVQIRAAFSEDKIDPTRLTTGFMGWVDRRLWVSLPYSGSTPVPTHPETVFVYDPVLSSWTMFRGANRYVPGPYIERSEMDTYESEVAVLHQQPYAVALDADLGEATDMCVPGTLVPFDTRLRTRWIDAGAPTWKKSWRRPDFLLRSLTVESTLNVQVFHDFDYGNAQRSFVVEYTPDDPPALYGTFDWGDGTLYGGSLQTTSVERGGTMGRAGTVQLLMTGFPTVHWGLNGIVFKFIPRRFR